jgi:hypothetical protein
MTITVTIPRHCEWSKAIHAGILDCFTAFAMKEAVGRLYELSYSLFALQKVE